MLPWKVAWAIADCPTTSSENSTRIIVVLLRSPDSSKWLRIPKAWNRSDRDRLQMRLVRKCNGESFRYWQVPVLLLRIFPYASTTESSSTDHRGFFRLIDGANDERRACDDES